jgi:hypothetical protein
MPYRVATCRTVLQGKVDCISRKAISALTPLLCDFKRDVRAAPLAHVCVHVRVRYSVRSPGMATGFRSSLPLFSVM